MSTLSAEQKLEIRHTYEREQFDRKQQREGFYVDVPKRAKSNELPKAFKLLEFVDAYLKLCELSEGTEDNALYSQAVMLRDIAVTRVTGLIEARKVAVAAAEAKEDGVTSK